MALVVADRVKETTSTSGTGTLTLGGAVTQFQSFSSGIGVGNTCDICILDANGTDWETANDCVVGSGTLTRGNFQASSTGSVLNLSSGVHTVYSTLTAERYRLRSANGYGNGILPSSSYTSVQSSGITPNFAINGSSSISVSCNYASAVKYFCGWYAPIPTTVPYRVVLYAKYSSEYQTYSESVFGVGFGWTNGTSSELISSMGAYVFNYNTSPINSLTTTYSSLTVTNMMGSISRAALFGGCWIGFYYDGTTVTLQFSPDGVNFYPVYAITASSGYLGASGYSNIYVALVNQSTSAIPSQSLCITVWDNDGIGRTY